MPHLLQSDLRSVTAGPPMGKRRATAKDKVSEKFSYIKG
jgi:hypothetical protein